MNCSIDVCEKPRKVLGWCSMHYVRWRKHGDPLVVLPRRNKRAGTSKHSPERLKMLYAEIGTVTGVGKALGVSPFTAAYHLRRAGISTRSNGWTTPNRKSVGVGSAHHRWKGGRWTGKEGYVWVYAPDHPNNAKGYMKEHRLVMEKKLGRYLTRHELVHHKNGIRSDNRRSNLEVMSYSEHMKHHKALGDRDARGRFT